MRGSADGASHGGAIGGEHWLARDNPHAVVDTLEVTDTLTIEAGVEVCVEPDVPLLIAATGIIEARGTEASPVVLTTGDVARPWGGIIAPSDCHAPTPPAGKCTAGESVLEPFAHFA